jgi:aminopeptidase N
MSRIDVHSFAQPEQARVTHMALDWDVDFEQHRIRGTVTLDVERRPGPAQLVLDTRELEIEDVEAQGEGWGAPARFELGQRDAILGRPLSIQLPESCTAVQVRYASSPQASGLQWLSPEQTATRSKPYLFSQAQAIHARSFVPCQDSPGIRVTWEASVRVRDGQAVVMSGERLEPGADGAQRFAMRQAVPPYLIAIAVGDLEFAPIGPRTGVWSEPGVAAAGAREFADLEAMLAAVERLYGPYRWGRYDVLVLPPSSPFGGMENPMMTFATPTLLAGDRSLANVIAHELAHSWSGNLVTNATWRDFWLNEGFTVYVERRIVEEVYGSRWATQQGILGRMDLGETLSDMKETPGDSRLYIDLAGRDPDDGLTDVAYEKGNLFLLHLERAVGRERFDPFLRAWFDEHAFQPVTTADFEIFLTERLLGGSAARARELAVQEWLYGEFLPAATPQLDMSVYADQAAAATAFALGARPAAALAAGAWNTNEWLHFLRSLPAALPAERLAELDAAWRLSIRTNCEVACAWLEIAIRNQYGPAMPRLESFLVGVGRRKFVKPLFTELVKLPGGRPRALEIYARARPGYHPITAGTIDKIVGWPAN